MTLTPIRILVRFCSRRLLLMFNIAISPARLLILLSFVCRLFRVFTIHRIIMSHVIFRISQSKAMKRPEGPSRERGDATGGSRVDDARAPSHNALFRGPCCAYST